MDETMEVDATASGHQPQRAVGELGNFQGT